MIETTARVVRGLGLAFLLLACVWQIRSYWVRDWVHESSAGSYLTSE